MAEIITTPPAAQMPQLDPNFINALGQMNQNVSRYGENRNALLESVLASRLVSQRVAEEQTRGSQLRTKEYREEANVRLREQAAQMGIPVKESDGPTEISDKIHDRQTRTATNVFNLYNERLKQVQDKKLDTLGKLTSIANEKPTTDINIKALRDTLADPSVKIPTSVRDRLNEILVDEKDPTKAVKQAFQELQNRNIPILGVFLPGYRGTKAGAVAMAGSFMQSYTQNVGKYAGPQKQTEVSAYLNQLTDLDRQGQDITAKLDTHVATSAGFLSDDTVKDYFKSVATPPENPNDLSGALTKGTGASAGPTTATPTPTPPPPMPGPPGPGGLPVGNISSPNAGNQFPMRPVDAGFSTVNAPTFPPAAMPPSGLNPLMQQMSPSEVAKQEVLKRVQSGDVGSAMQATTQERQAVHVLNKQLFPNAPEDGSNLENGIAKNDPNAIAGWNYLLQQVRARGGSNPTGATMPLPTMPQLPQIPVGNTSLSPQMSLP